MIRSVKISVPDKVLAKLPQAVLVRLRAWVANVEENGLEAVRKIPGLHDEPLKGKRAGQRSIRLGKAYRAIYVIGQEVVELKTIEFANVTEVHKHRY